MPLDLVPVAAAILLLHDMAGPRQVHDDPVGGALGRTMMTETQQASRGIDQHVSGTSRGEDWEGRHKEAGRFDMGTEGGAAWDISDERDVTSINLLPRTQAGSPFAANQRYLARSPGRQGRTGAFREPRPRPRSPDMTTQQPFVIIGGGLAGAKAAEAIRKEGFHGQVVLVSEEAERPYDRPPLSKDYLLGKSEREKVFVHPEEWYSEHDVDLRLHTRATAVDRATHEVVMENSQRLGYDKLLLATGSSPRHLAVPGHDLGGVLYLRGLEDCEVIKAAFAAAQRVCIIGAGWIGLETAVAARAAGAEVTVIEMAELPLLAVLGREVAEIYASLHREHGVDLRLGVKVAEITGADGRATGVRLADDAVIGADVVVVGVGIAPNTGLAEAAGLAVDDGIVVDENLHTTAPDIFAAGDVANAYYPFYDRHIRLEHWSAALNQGPVAAANMTGRLTAYDKVPYFFSDQYDMGMEYSGYVGQGGYDRVIIRGDVAKREFLAFWMGNGRVLAGMNVNIWDVTDAVQTLVRSGRSVDTAKLADPSVPLGDLAAS